MIVVGLTGSIGMGKSAVAAMFRAEGVPVFDADAAVHEMQGPQGHLVVPIESAFPGTTTHDGVDRGKLSATVFGNAEQLRRLEAIVHPAVAERRADFLMTHAAAPMLVFDIPLLLEKGRTPDIDTVIVVSAPAAVQRERVLSRPGMTVEKFESILRLQMSDAEKRTHADHVIDTATPLSVTRARVREVIACLNAAKGG